MFLPISRPYDTHKYDVAVLCIVSVGQLGLLPLNVI